MRLDRESWDQAQAPVDVRGVLPVQPNNPTGLPRSGFEVFNRFKELSAGKTAILISHRFSSVRMADRILVLADGTVESSGTHEKLLAARGRYAELFELQARGYR